MENTNINEESNWLDKNKNKFNKVITEALDFLSPEKKTVIREEINKQIDQWEYFAKGYEWTIYKINIEWEKYIAAKVKKNKWSIKSEMKFQKDYYKISQSVIWANVPQAYWGLKVEDEEFLIMEYIDWLTLFSIKINATLKLLHKETWINQYKEIENDKDAHKEIKKMIDRIKNDINLYSKFWKYIQHINKFRNWIRYEQALSRIYDYLTKDYNIWIYSESEIQKFQDSLWKIIEEAQKNWIFHNDLSHRNLIIGSDWQIHIIDFWLSSHLPEWILQDKYSINYFNYFKKSTTEE